MGLTLSQIGMKNRIINGNMAIDQRNVGASVTQSNAVDVFPVDRWKISGQQNAKFTAQQNAGSVTPPVGFVNYLGCTSSSAYAVLTGDNFSVNQQIEGFNIADLGWGTANAKTITLSFWVRSSLTGTFGGALSNNAVNRSYPFTYTISAANTWEFETITITGDTSGTWLTTNGIGIRLWFNLGAGATFIGTAGAWAGADYRSATGAVSVVGTNLATFYITGVQLEVGSAATTFDFRSYGTELALCQRYFEKSFNQETAPAQNVATTAGCLSYGLQAASTQFIGASAYYAVVKRIAPTVTVYNPYAAGSGWSAVGSGNYTASVYGNGTSGLIIRNDDNMGGLASGMMLIQWTASAEL
jgi:hypothetical protein